MLIRWKSKSCYVGSNHGKPSNKIRLTYIYIYIIFIYIYIYIITMQCVSRSLSSKSPSTFLGDRISPYGSCNRDGGCQ